MDALLTTLSQLIVESVWIAPVLAIVAGLLSSFTPCALASVPLIVGYVGGLGERTTKRAFLLSLTFAIGSAVTFTTLGIVATAAGSLIGTSSDIWNLFLGVLMLLMGLQVLGLYEFIPSTSLTSKFGRTGFIGAFIAGILGGIFSSPCSTPVLIALLAVVAGKGSFTWGVVLLLLYSFGHGILAVVCGTSVGFVQKISISTRYNKLSNALKIIMGILILLISLYMFYLAF